MEIGTPVRIKTKNLYGIIEYIKEYTYLVFSVNTPTELHKCNINDLEIIEQIL